MAECKGTAPLIVDHIAHGSPKKTNGAQLLIVKRLLCLKMIIYRDK